MAVYKTETFTLTFGDQAENHVGMQKIGELATHGFDLDDLKVAQKWFENVGVVCELISLHDSLPKEHLDSSLQAYVLVARKGINAILDSPNGADNFFNEQKVLEKDTKAFMYGRVVNKNARHNLCFGPNAQSPDYSSGKGTIIAYSDVPILSKFRTTLPNVIGDKAADLTVEGNYYYDVKKCGIGFHGDTERRKVMYDFNLISIHQVVGVRVGASFPLRYVWYFKGSPISSPVDLMLNHGDLYIMSEKATGQDWKKKNVCTLRHAAGADKFLTIKEKKKKAAKKEEISSDDESESDSSDEEVEKKKKKKRGSEKKKESKLSKLKKKKF